MQVTERIHAIKIFFKIPVSAEMTVDRFAYTYLVFGKKIHLIDSGVAGAESLIWEYIKKQGREPEEIDSLILTHSHPDHIGAAKRVKTQTGCTIFAHKYEQTWIEDVEQQFKDRPVPGFQMLVAGPVGVDNLVEGGEILELEKDISCQIIHTPGHSPGSISLFFEKEKSLFTADALVLPGDLPISEDISDCLASITAMQEIENLDHLFSSWEAPIQGREEIRRRMADSIDYLKRIHAAVMSRRATENNMDIMTLCREVVRELGLPPFAATPLVAKAFASSLAAQEDQKVV